MLGSERKQGTLEMHSRLSGPTRSRRRELEFQKRISWAFPIIARTVRSQTAKERCLDPIYEMQQRFNKRVLLGEHSTAQFGSRRAGHGDIPRLLRP